MSSAKKPVRIGNAQAFWGDRIDAAAEMLAREPELDYLTLDFLAEVSMSILAMQRERDPSAGYAREFVEVIRSLVPYWASGGQCRIVANAGGLNPQGCADACLAVLAECGCRSLKVGIVSGDDVLDHLRKVAKTLSPAFQNLDTGANLQEVRDRLVTANAYLGASPIAEALRKDANIVITGRVADPSLVVASCLHHFGWRENELDRLAGATIAGHLIECGTQVTGGISTDWLDVPDAAHIGFPIVDVFEDGSCVVTKPRGTGGRVTEMTVKEQLLYEIGDPVKYLSPDVTVSFLALSVEDQGNERVRVSGATGMVRPDSLKVSATYRDGFRAAGTLTIVGRHAVEKAGRVGELVLQRVREADFKLRDSIVETIGGKSGEYDVEQCVLRIAVEADTSEAAERFARELMPHITAGPQGTTGYAEGRPRVHPVFRYWPCLVDQGAIAPQVTIVSSRCNKQVNSCDSQPFKIENVPTMRALLPVNRAVGDLHAPSHLFDVATARSGDKGSSANIGVIARNRGSWEFLESWLSADMVGAYFAPLGVESVERFELPNLGALNFVLRGVLRRNLRLDAQGKALGQMLLEMPLPADVKLGSIVQREAT